ncbi:ABC transporter ATP-binding protein, partial [Flexivirga sp.]|uniref:ABC transporter ATP-binding protein n=1 Tax=Flexivirga sp. TaxID=1962927 RepID=UPI003F7F3C99
LLARSLGLRPHSPIARVGLIVRDVVGRGRHPHQRWFQQWSHGDEDIVTDAMRWTGILELADRPVDALSGGQRQRVWIAMTLAQHTDLVLLDEPTTYLDLAHQVDVLDLVCRLNRERGATVAMVLHDLNLAVRFSDHLVVMHRGRVVAQGDPAAVLDAELLLKVFGLDADMVADPRTGLPMVVPRGQRRGRREEG